jgi:hypothetical protein
MRVLLLGLVMACGNDKAAQSSPTDTGAFGSDSEPVGGGGDDSGDGPECDDGYEWNGDECTDIDECAEDNGGCGDPAVFECINREGAEPICRYDPTEDWLALVKNVDSIPIDGAYFSTLVSHGDMAFPVIMDASNRALVAAARRGDGRVFHVGHESLIGGALSGDGDAAALFLNAIDWAGPAESSVIGVQSGYTSAGNLLSDAGYTVETRGPSDVSGIDVWVGGVYDELTDEQAITMQEFVENGGGLVTGGHAWYWSYSNDNAAENHPANRMFWGAGLTLTADYSSPSELTVGETPVFPLVQASWALDEMMLHQSGEYPLEIDEQGQAADTVSYAVNHLPLSFDDYYDRVRAFRAEVEDVVPTAEEPIVPATEPIAALVVSIDCRFAAELPVDELTAHESAADFPGAVPDDAGRVNAEITVDARYAGMDDRYWYAGSGADLWRSTGLYAPPGEIVTVTVPDSAVGRGLGVLVGVHTDTIWHVESWSRMPNITRATAIDSATTEVANAFGGLIHLTVPAGEDLGEIVVSIDGAVEAPVFRLGQHSNDDWIAHQRDLPAPWAQLEGQWLNLIVPAQDIRDLDDPEALMSLWDAVMEADYDLMGLDPTERPRAEQFVFDRQISAGWMHSGYPIMAHLESVAENLDVDTLMTNGSWGPVHELGHNHQNGDWYIPGTTETTCNLYSVYASEEVFGLDRSVAHSALSPESRSERIAEYVDGGANFDDWSVWVALESYLQLQEAFGWAPFATVFAEYDVLPSSERPGDDQARIDRWVVRMSAATGVDLGPFYLAWGWPISGSALDDAATHPEWSENPM